MCRCTRQHPHFTQVWHPTTTTATQANIQEKADRSYYYAHRARVTSEEPAPPPVHVVLERTTVEAGPAVVTVFNYAFADEGDVVKVYIPLEGVGAACKDEDIQATFTVGLCQGTNVNRCSRNGACLMCNPPASVHSTAVRISKSNCGPVRSLL